jgi:hypothetical protein
LRSRKLVIRVIEFACDFLVKLHGDAHATRFRVHYRARLIAITPAAAGQDTRWGCDLSINPRLQRTPH